MAISNRTWDTSGNHQIEDGISLGFDTMTNLAIPAATRPAMIAGTGAPTLTAPKGSLYLRLDGSSTSTRMYVNTDGATTWTNVTTAA